MGLLDSYRLVVDEHNILVDIIHKGVELADEGFHIIARPFGIEDPVEGVQVLGLDGHLRFLVDLSFLGAVVQQEGSVELLIELFL